ncbi:MAG: cyclic nucleotide-binding domain-containing protein [Chloroflexi bacterium]|nr:cyclic nucleotide-binding domain-containing protein [Chloroflexota bacterium]
MLSTQEKIQLLQNVSSFHKLSNDQLVSLAELYEEKTFSHGDIIFRQGEVGGKMYVVIEGKVAVEREIRDRTDTVSIMIADRYDSIGEMSLFYNAPNSVTATAMEDTRTLWMENGAFIDFARNDPDLLVELCQVLSKRLFEAYDRISEISKDQKPLELRKLYEKLDF